MKIRKIVRSRVADSVHNGSSYKDHTDRTVTTESLRDNLPDFLTLIGEKLVEEAQELQVELLKVADTLRKNTASKQDVYNLAVLDELGDVTEVIDTLKYVLNFDKKLVKSIIEHKNRAKGTFLSLWKDNYFVYTADSHTYHEKYAILREEKKETQ